jgi:hypothetical protein
MPSATLDAYDDYFVDENAADTAHYLDRFVSVGYMYGTGPLDGGSSTTNHWPSTGGRTWGLFRFDLSSLGFTGVETITTATFNATCFYDTIPGANGYVCTFEVCRYNNLGWNGGQTWNGIDPLEIGPVTASTSIALASPAIPISVPGLQADVQSAIPDNQVSWLMRLQDADVANGCGINLTSARWSGAPASQLYLEWTTPSSFTSSSGLTLLGAGTLLG